MTTRQIDKRIEAVVSTQSTGGNLAINYAEGFALAYPTFPKMVPPTEGPDPAQADILLRLESSQLDAGFPVISYYIKVSWDDWRQQYKEYADDTDYDVHSKGAWLSCSYSAVLVTATGLKLASQVLYPEDSGFANITIVVRNSGDAMAYNVNMTVVIPDNITILFETVPVAYDAVDNLTTSMTSLTLHMGVPLSPGASQAYRVTVRFYADTRDGAGAGAGGGLGSHMVAASARGDVDLTPSPGERHVTQALPTPFAVAYSGAARPSYVAVLRGARAGGGEVAALDVTHQIADVRAYLWRFRAPDTPWATLAVTTGASLDVVVADAWHNITQSHATAYASPVIDFMVSLTRDAAASLTTASTPVVLTETNVWQWNDAAGNNLLLLLLIPGIVVPTAGLALLFFLKRGTPATPAPPPPPAKASEMTQVSHAQRYVPPAAATAGAGAGEGAAGAVAVEVGGGAAPEGPTYLMRGCQPINVVDSHAV
eukprot:TRINITY_DN2957_c0_g1_i2.p1 TRINITY_DN2957_c0_g1~~TRINITY_DN2957_c0_g1_i2.p1  ORF type:complete len:510 (-),score=196.83 TRINITY_DN2957_c0_g1_i2:66-1514(-)